MNLIEFWTKFIRTCLILFSSENKINLLFVRIIVSNWTPLLINFILFSINLLIYKFLLKFVFFIHIIIIKTFKTGIKLIDLIKLFYRRYQIKLLQINFELDSLRKLSHIKNIGDRIEQRFYHSLTQLRLSYSKIIIIIIIIIINFYLRFFPNPSSLWWFLWRAWFDWWGSSAHGSIRITSLSYFSSACLLSRGCSLFQWNKWSQCTYHSLLDLINIRFLLWTLFSQGRWHSFTV